MNMFSSNKAWPVKSARLTKRWAFGYCSAFHLGKVDLWQVFIYECALHTVQALSSRYVRAHLNSSPS